MPELVPISPDRIDADAAKVVRRLVRFGHEAYLVGGCVRDLLLGRTPKDFDLSTSATPDEIKKLFRNCRIIGRRFRLAHIFFQGKKIIETSTFRDSPHQDSPGSSEELLIRRDNIFGTAEQDAMRRDFTINGLFYDLKQNKVIDYVDGLADLRSQTMRTIGAPRIRFQEDPVRILRAIRFAARLEFTLEPATEQALIEFRGLIATCAPARIIEEIYRLLGIGHAAAIFRLLHETGVMAVLFPELRALLGRPANPLACVPVLPMQPGSSRMQPKAPAPAASTQSADHAAADEDPPMPENGPAAQPEEAPSDPANTQELPSQEHQPDPVGPDPVESDDPVICEESAELLVLRILNGAEQSDLEENEQVPAATDEQLRQFVIQRFWEHLAALDQWLATSSSSPPSHALMLSAPLLSLALPILMKAARPYQIVSELEPLLSSVTTRLQVSRKDKERLREILLAQRRLTSRGRRGRPMALVQRDYFADALQLLQLHSLASGDHQEALSRWQKLMDEAPRPNRRKRRRGPRRRPKGPPA